MTVRIVRGSQKECLEKLRQGAWDLDEYPLKTYSSAPVHIAGGLIPVIQGVNTVPQSRFVVASGEAAGRYACRDVPGVVPFLGSAYQVTAAKRPISPDLDGVGLPNLAAADDHLIRWMFDRDGSATHAGQTLWSKLTAERLDELPREVLPDPSVEPDIRRGDAYRRVSRATAYPEPIEMVSPRVDGCAHEPWLARSVELATAWRVVVPNTSTRVVARVVPPELTIIGQNMNVALCPSGEVALAIAATLARPEVCDYIAGIAPWAQGNTPRPRGKHVNAALGIYRSRIEKLIGGEAIRMNRLATGLHLFWSAHLDVVVALARRSIATGHQLRDHYRSIDPREASGAVVTGLRDLKRRELILETHEGDVRLVFDHDECAALAAVALWTAMPLGLSIADVLVLSLAETKGLEKAVQEVFFSGSWQALVGTT